MDRRAFDHHRHNDGPTPPHGETCHRCGSDDLYAVESLLADEAFLGRIQCRGCGRFVRMLERPIPGRYREHVAPARGGRRC